MTLALAPIEWSDAAAAHLAMAAAVADAEGEGVSADWYRAEYEAGRLALVGGMVNGVHVATAGFRIETTAHGTEFVITGCGGSAGGYTLTVAFFPALEAMAQAAGCRSMRFHTGRAGLISRAQAAGFFVSETVMRKVL